MKQVNLIDNYELDQIDIGSLTGFTGHNIPFLWCGDDNLRLINLLLCQMGVTR